MSHVRVRRISGFGGLLAWVLVSAPLAVAAGGLPADVGTGALFVRGGGAGDWLPAPVLDTEVSLRVTGLVARARVVQRFTNESDLWLEGLYLFPLPEGAAVDHLDLRVGERVIEGQIQERAVAKKTYRKAKAEGQRASLVEQQRPNLFTTRVANLGPGEAVEVAIEYQETLRYRDGGYELRFPLVAAPRFEAPAAAAAEPRFEAPAAAAAGPRFEGPAAAPGWQLASLAAPALAGLGMPRLAPAGGPLNPVRIDVEIDAGLPLAALYSPTHAVAVESAAGGARHRVFARDYADRDFVLAWRPEAGSEPRAALFSETRGDGAYALLMVMPPDPESAAPRLSREVVFVVDTSGSMGGAAIEQARRALLLALERLEPRDHFNVIHFDDTSEAVFAASVPADRAHLEQARRAVRGLRANGGTVMAPALEAALGGDAGRGEVRQVVFITDGSIGNEEQLFRIVERNLGRSRLFPVGIGSAPNAHFLSRAASHGRGTPTTIANPGEVDEKMGALFRKLESPVLSEIEVLWNDAVEMWPQRVPDLYAGEPVVVAAEVPRFVGEVVVRGRRGDRPWEMRLPLEPGRRQGGLGVLWARRKIEAAMEALALGADPATVRELVLEVALEHHLVSRFTSLVAVDVTPARPRGERLASSKLPLNLPAGWEPSAVGVLPQTATPALLYQGTGVALLLAAALAASPRRQRS